MFYPLERLINVYDGFQRSYHIQGHSLLLLQDNGRCYLLHNRCPHQQAPFSPSRGAHQAGGSQVNVSQGQLRCPVHGMTFDLITGKTSDGCSQSLQFLSIVYEGNQMGVDL